MTEKVLDDEFKSIVESVRRDLLSRHKYINDKQLVNSIREYLSQVLLTIQNDDVMIWGLSKQFEDEANTEKVVSGQQKFLL